MFNVEITVNKSKLSGFLIDNERKLRVPKWFAEEGLSDVQRMIFETLADYCLRVDEYTIPAIKATLMLENNGISWNNSTSSCLIDLAEKGYISMVITPAGR